MKRFFLFRLFSVLTWVSEKSTDWSSMLVKYIMDDVRRNKH